MKNSKLIYFQLLLILGFIAQGFSKNNTEFEPRNAAMFRLVSSGLSEEKVDGYSSEVQVLLSEKTGWQIMNHQVTTQKIRDQGGDWFCSKVNCAIVSGQYLQVDYVIFGTVQTIGKAMSISVQIADVSTGRVVSDVSKFYTGKESSFVHKIIPSIAEKLAIDVRTIRITSQSQIEKSKLTTQKSLQKQTKSKSFNDVRGYLSYSESKNPAYSISTEGKMAFGYLMTGVNATQDDVLRYSYQLQSYLSLAGAHAMLYIDEMELLMQVRGGDLKCPDRTTAKNIGRLLGVDFMGYGRISRFGKSFLIRTNIVDVETGAIVKKAVKFYRGKENVFLTEVIPDVADQLGDTFMKSKDSTLSKQKEASAYSNYR